MGNGGSYQNTLYYKTNSAVSLVDGIQRFTHHSSPGLLATETHNNNFRDFMADVKSTVIDLISESIKSYHTLKVNMEVFAQHQPTNWIHPNPSIHHSVSSSDVDMEYQVMKDSGKIIIINLLDMPI